ncbi:flavohemoglobin [Cadophora sp. DSE1049]|nr:flavohemoglobin [Cadophora sp. DSE1049]
MALTPSQVAIIKATVPVVQVHGNAITAAFYSNMITDNPSLKNIFSSTHQDTGAQPRALAASLVAYATYIDDLGVLAPAVERICQKHVSLYVLPEHYDIVGKYLLEAMGQILGDALTPDILDAWAAAYGQLAAIMIGREKTLYSEFAGWDTWRQFRVARKEAESETVTSFYLEPVDGGKLPFFKPGQYLSVQLKIEGLGCLQSRQYSLSDAPGKSYYRISVKREGEGLTPEGEKASREGLVSNALHATVNVGDTINVSHPAGEFFLEPKAATNSTEAAEAEPPIVLLAAGVGITPMLSILNTLVESGTERRISFIYGSRSSTQHPFATHVHSLKTTHSKLDTVIFKKNVDGDDTAGVDYHFTGRFDLDKVDGDKDLFLSDKGTKYFVCGPVQFMEGTKSWLEKAGVESERINMEVFGTGDGK